AVDDISALAAIFKRNTCAQHPARLEPRDQVVCQQVLRVEGRSLVLQPGDQFGTHERLPGAFGCITDRSQGEPCHGRSLRRALIAQKAKFHTSFKISTRMTNTFQLSCWINLD